MTSELEQDSGLTPPAMLTVAAVARRLGVAPSTLRTWDRRYGLGPSTHTAGSHRRYSPSDVTRLVVMRGLVVEGVPPAEAAQIALSTPVDSESHERPAAGSAGAGSAAASAVERAMPVRGIGTSAAEPGALSSSWAAPAPPRHPGQSVRGQSGAARSSGSAALSPVVEPPAPSVPASRGMPLHEGVPRPDDVLHPEGAGRAVWPMSPLAAQHLLQAEGAAAAPSVVPVPGHLLGDPAAAEGDVLDPVALEAAGRDAALAGVIADALRRSGPGPDHPGWSGPTGRAGGGRVISLPDASPRARGLARAAMSLDTHELGRLLRDAIGSYGVIGAWNTMVLPVLRGLGDRWEATGDGIDVEHAFAEATLGVLRGVSATLYRPRNVRPVLLACADGDQHHLPLHVLSAALTEVEIGCRVLGVGLPAPALVAATRRTGPAVVFVYARLPVSDGSTLREFPRQRPAPRVLVGGPGWGDVDLPPGVCRVDSLQAAVDEVRAAVHL